MKKTVKLTTLALVLGVAMTGVSYEAKAGLLDMAKGALKGAVASAKKSADSKASAQTRAPAQQNTRTAKGPAKKQFCCEGGKCMNSACTVGDECQDGPAGQAGTCYATAAEGKNAAAQEEAQPEEGSEEQAQ